MKMASCIAIWIALNSATGFAASAQTDTTFTYQAELMESGSLANGTFNVDFTLWDDALAGAQIGSPVMFNSLAIVDGRFTVELDYGAESFDNSDRWLEITVNSTTLTPRQPITRSPYSIQTRGIFVDENNNVGIGTSTPSYPLHVESDGDLSIVSLNHSPSGFGVYGWTTSNTGTTFGVYGESESTSGRGVYGFTSASTGDTYGVFGASVSPTGRGVFGLADATTGQTFGGYFQSESTSGRGVFGLANAGTGITDGVFGQSNSTSGRGLCGWAPSSSGTTYGVFGTCDSTNGAGVFGEARATTGSGAFGGRFMSDGVLGNGVQGVANHPTGLTKGVSGVNSSVNGKAIEGHAVSFTGTNYGVFGMSNSNTGFDFFAGGLGADYGASSSRRWKHNVEPISDPLRKLAQLRGVYFDWDDEHGGAHDVGMIAEEVGEVLPEIVNYEENGVDAIGMDYSKMTPLLVEAVNALSSQRDSDLASLHAENDELRGVNAALRDRLDSLESVVRRLANEEEETSK